ncbi:MULTISPECIES: phosphatase PAP2 family protein [Humibacter]
MDARTRTAPPLSPEAGAQETRRARRALAPLRHPALWVAAGIAAMVLVLVTGLVLDGHPSWSAAELAVDEWAGVGSPALIGVVALVFDITVSTAAGVVLLLIAALMVYLMADGATAVVFVGGVCLAWLASTAVSLAVNRPLLESSAGHTVVSPGALSYPSTPTAFGTATVIGLLLAARGSNWRWLVALAGGIALAVSLWARLYLGAGYPTDVVAGVLVGGAVAAIYYPVMLDLVLPAMRRRNPSR